MSGYRTFYDYRKNYDLKSSLSKDDKSKSSVSDKSDSLSKYTSGSSNASNYRPYVSSYTSSSANKDKTSDKLGYRSSSKEPEKASTLIREKYASSSTKEPEKASTLIREKYGSGSTKEPEKASTLIREKYATGSSTRESTTPSYRLSRKDEPPPPTALTRHLSRSGLSRSRDPSPVDRGSNLTSSSYTPYRSAYASNVAFAISKLTRRNSKEDLSTSAPSKPSSYTASTNSLGRTSRRNSKEDLTNITTPSTLSRRNSKEDIFSSVSSSPRYGSSSLRTYSSLPRTEKSTTSHTPSIYSPPSSISTTGTRILTRAKINTTPTLKSSKDNLLTVLKTPSSEKIDSRPVSRQSSHNEEIARKSNDNIPKIDLSKSKSEECITVTVVTRGTSPTPPSSSSYLRSKRSDMARVLQKDIKRPKERPEMVDKEMQSDRMDDTARYSRFGSSTKVATMPWSTYLDLKYTSPTSSSGFTSASRYARTGSGYSGYSSAADSSESLKSRAKTPEIDNTKSKESSPPSTTSSKTSAGVPRLSESPSKSLTEKSVSLTEKSTSLADKSVSSTDKSASLTKTDSSSKVNEKVKIPKKITSASKSKSNSTAEASKLLPPSSPKSTSLKPSSSTSSLNSANKDFRKSVLNMSPNNSTKNIKQLKHSTSSGDSDTSLNAKPTGKVLQKTNSSSKIVRSPRTSKSPSVESTTSTSGATSSDADDDILASKSSQLSNRSSNNLKNSKSQASIKAPSEELTLPTGKVKKSPTGSKISSQRSQSEKSEPISSSQATDAPSLKTESVSAKKKESDSENNKYKIRPIESGERAWWLDENSSKKPTDSSQATNASSIKVDSNKTENSEKEKPKFKIRPVQSGERAWWLDENSSNKDENKSSKSKEEPSKSNKFLNLPKLNINHIGSGDRDMWLKNFGNEKESKNSSISESKKSSKVEKSGSKLKLNLLKRVESGEKPWWMMSKSHIPDGVECLDSGESDSDDVDDVQEPLGDRLSPDGIEATKNEENCTGRLSPYDNVPSTETNLQAPKHSKMFISKHTNIDDILGSSQPYSPLIDCILAHGFTAKKADGNESSSTSSSLKLDDSVLQLYKDGDYSSYLDMEASINEQPEEFEGFQSNRKNSIVLRTQLSVRVHNIIEKLLNSEGRELRRALFSLKQIFQEDKDLVHEFVQNDGLSCLIKVGSEADQNYQNYILRALGQVMLYVDGMNGVMEHNQTVQWLYTLIASRFRLVVKTALKLLLVFVEYVESNCLLLIKAIHSVDKANGVSPWNIVMRLLKDYDAADTELLIYATTLINKCLNGIPDQDTYYDQVDCLEEQGIEGIIQRYMSRQGTDLDLLRQFQIYEAVLEHEDGENKESPLRQLDETIRKTLRNRKSLADSNERRKSRRHSTGTSSVAGKINNYSKIEEKMHNEEEESSSSQSSQGLSGDKQINGRYNKNNEATGAGVTPALRRRRERAERQRSFMREQETVATFRASLAPSPEENGHPNSISDLQQKISNGSFILKQSSSRKDIVNGSNKLETLENGEKQEQNGNSSILKKPWVLSMMYSKSQDENGPQSPEVIEISGDENSENIKNKLQLKKESSVKDLTQKLASQNILHSPVEEMKNRIGDMSGLINKAKEGLAKSKSKVDVLKSPTGENLPKLINDVKKSENELHWEELIRTMDRPLNLCDLDFTDMHSDDEINVLAPAIVSSVGPPPPPPIAGGMIPPPFGGGMAPPPPPSSNRFTLPAVTPPAFPSAPVFGAKPLRNDLVNSSKSAIPVPKKNKKTVKLFWKEVRGDPIALMKLRNDGGGGGMIWDELNPVSIDTQKLEHLFESRAKDLLTKKQQELNKNKEIIVLDHKRSNAINIGMTKLPPPRSIKTAILKMDATVMNREGIEKLLTMLPTEEERTRIQDAQATNPDLPLGSAEQFLLTLASISELPARLKLWAFKLDFESSEREIAEPLMDLKQGMELLKANKTFRAILSTLLSIGIFLNGSEVKGFQIEYLAKVPEVKDTVHKHSLLHHLCYMVMEKFPDATDLYSEIGAVTRVSKVDFDELNLNIQRLETDCKASWDHLKLIAKHDGTTMMKVKMSDFLADCAERIILLSIIHRRVKNRFHKFLLWLGVPMHRISDTKPSEFCRVISEFALEYRTTRERVLQQLEKKANHRERNKTRGKMITEVGKFRTKEDRADAELRHLLGNDVSDVESLQGTLPWRRKKSDATKPCTLGLPNGDLTDADDEILESLVKTATKAPTSRTMPRERKRTRNVDRKSMRRTLKNGLSEEEKKHIAAYIKGY